MKGVFKVDWNQNLFIFFIQNIKQFIMEYILSLHTHQQLCAKYMQNLQKTFLVAICR